MFQAGLDRVLPAATGGAGAVLMARRGPADTWICYLCDRALHESQFAQDAYRKRHNKGPGRCLDCEREYSRALTATSPTGKYSDGDHPAALNMAKETCRAHAWGRGYYTQTAVSKAKADVATKRIRGRRELTAGERNVAEEVLVETGERRQVMELRELDKRAAEREKPADTIPAPIPAADSDRKAAVRAARLARRNPDWEPEKFGG